MSETKAPATEAEIRSQALRRLGIREHSQAELQGWLQGRFGGEAATAELIRLVLDSLVELGALSDLRFAKMLARHHFARGKGPAYIRGKLREKGLRAEVSEIRAWLSEERFGERALPEGEPMAEIDPELEQAVRVAERRYAGFREDPKVANRAFAALMRRGFSSETIRKALQKTRSSE